MIAPDTLLQNRYLVIKQIGEGGMGAVYVATDQRFGSTVALKETFFTDPSLRRAFEREARLLNRLRHPALPRVSDHFMEEDGQFLVMEFIAGDDLSEMLKVRGTPFPVSDVLAWADQLLDALDYLHTQDPPVVHRDIKPQNLKLAGRNQIVLLDFGLAKGTPAQLTAQGSSVFGYSLNYAPIEQMQGTGTDPRSDLYSLGATLYHLLTGVAPPDALTRATAVLNGQPDPLRPADEINPQVSSSIASILGRSLAQSAAQRPQTAHEMREALRAAARETAHATAQTTETADAAATRLATVSPDSSEQQTRLLGSRTSAAASSSSKETNVQDYGTAASTEMATLVGHTSGTQPSPATRVDSSPAHAATAEEASIVTRVRPSPARRSRGLLVGGIAAAVVCIAAIAGVYAYMRQTPAPASTTSTQSATPTPQATPEPTPAVLATETQTPAPSPATQAQRPGRQQGRTAAGSDAEARRGEAGQTPRTPVPPDARDSEFGLTPEEEAEIQRNAEEARREGERARREALRAVRQMLEQQRRQRIQEERRRRDEQRRGPLPVPTPPRP
ncbi:MAG TPA: protein kinase [Pyrinomonadaceae bacterium]|nr:protein kinase [Pyrinomonadaceae bacterium]